MALVIACGGFGRRRGVGRIGAGSCCVLRGGVGRRNGVGVALGVGRVIRGCCAAVDGRWVGRVNLGLASGSLISRIGVS